jgi:hypothetical protein
MVTKSRLGFGDEHFGSYFRELRNNFWVKILKCFVADANPVSGSGSLFDLGSGMEKIWIWDPG